MLRSMASAMARWVTMARTVRRPQWQVHTSMPKVRCKATELCPLAIQILDVPHAVHGGMQCGKALLGEGHAALPLCVYRSPGRLST